VSFQHILLPILCGDQIKDDMCGTYYVPGEDMKEKIENFSQKIRREDNKHKQNFIQKF
jgi:hypothetical protein